MGSDLREKGRESVDGADGVNLVMGIGKTLRGGVVDASDQVMGFIMAKVPLERVLRWRTHRRKGERKETEEKGRRESKKKVTAYFFFLSSGTKLSFRMKLVGFKIF